MKRKKDRTGAGGVAIVTAIVNLDMEWIYRPQDHSGTDYGVDAQFEVTDDEGVETGRLIGVQVKSGQSYFRERAPEGFIHRPSERHVRYWEAYGLPVILVLVDPKTRTAYWVATVNIEKVAQGWKLVVPRNQTLGLDAKAPLSAIAVGQGTERTRAKTEEREREKALRARVDALETMLASYTAALSTREKAPASKPPAPPTDILALSFPDLVRWSATADFERDATAPETRNAFVLAAEHLFFRPHIEEHDAAKAIALLLLAHDWGKAGSAFLYAVELARTMKRVQTPSIIDFWADAPLPAAMPRDLRIVQRASQVAARRKHSRDVGALLRELDRLVDDAEPIEGLAVIAAAFWEARVMARTEPDRALRYGLKAAQLRPGAVGVGGAPFPTAIDATWETILELLANGIASEEQLVAWLNVLDAVPEDGRRAFLADEMNCVGLANQFWLAESKRPIGDRAWSVVRSILMRLEAWSTEREQPLLFAAARRARIVVVGEYEDDLRGAIRLASDVPGFVSNDAHAMFLLNEIAASQFLYAGQHMEARVAFQDALARRPSRSSILPNTLLKAAQAASSVDAHADAVAWSHEAIDAAQNDPYRATTDLVVASAEHALATWFSGDRERALDLWDEVAEAMLAAEENTDRWRGLMVRFHWAGGYLAGTFRTGTPPKVDAEGTPYGEPRPGSFLIDLAGQAPAYSDKVRFGVLLGVAAIAERRERDDRTRRWTYAALDFATERIPEWRRMLTLFALPPLIADKNFAEALDLGRAMAEGFAADGLTPNADVVAMSFTIVPSFLAIAVLQAEEQRVQARAFHTALLALGADEPTWKACADVVDAAFLSVATSEYRMETIGEIRGADVARVAESPLPMLCDLAATVLPQLPTKTSLALQTRAVFELEPRLSIFPTMYRRHIVPFFEQYWRRRALAEPASFPDPAALLSRIRAAEDLGGKARIRAVLLAVAEGLSDAAAGSA